MARGGYRPGAGRPRKDAPQKVKSGGAKQDVAHEPKSPLEYMLGVMNDENADEARRDRMAISAAPFVHSRASDTAPSKKAERQAKAETAASAGSKFAPRSGPRLVSDNG